MNRLHYSFKKKARRIRIFHVGWILMLFLGAILELLWKPYTPFQLGLIIATFLFQIFLGDGDCPFTTYENLLLEKCDPIGVYWDLDTLKASFMEHNWKELAKKNPWKKFLKKDPPKHLTTKLLILVLVITSLRIIF